MNFITLLTFVISLRCQNVTLPLHSQENSVLSYNFTLPKVLSVWKSNVLKLEEAIKLDCSVISIPIESSNNETSSFTLIDLFAPFFAIEKDEAVCEASKTSFTVIHDLLQLEGTDASLMVAAKSSCISAGIGRTICNSYLNTFGALLTKIIRNMDFTKSYASQLLSFSTVKACPQPEIAEAKYNLPDPKPVSMEEASNSTVRILHLSDFHFDPLYKVGSEADCGRAICCQADSNSDSKDTSIIKKPASKWGEYTCDLPQQTLESMFAYIRDLHKKKPFDIVLYTGDVLAHDYWVENEDSAKSTEAISFNLLNSYLNITGLKFYPVIGNHEAVPDNIFPLDGQEESKNYFLYPFLANEWKKWLPDSAYDQVRKTGYYSVQHSPNLKIIGLNNNLCYMSNFLLLLDPEVSDPNNMFSWMIKELEDAEKAGSKVYLVAHVPPANPDCYQRFSITWHKIVKAYSHLIVGQFFGHAHNDQFQVFYNDGAKSKETAISSSYLGPSTTSFGNNNPGFRIYDADSNNYQIKDYTQYFTNLNEQLGWNNGPVWRELYSAKSAYPVPSSNNTYINAKFWHEVTELIEKDKFYWDRFFYFKYKGSGLQPKCNEKCKKNWICNMRASNSKQTCML